MPEESKQVDPAAEQAAETLTRMANGKQPTAESDAESDQDDVEAEAEAAEGSQAGSEAAKKKKKKSKRKKIKDALTGKSGESQGDGKKAIGGLTQQQISELMQLNPALAQELAQSGSSQGGSSSSLAQDPAATMEALKKLNLQDIMTGLASSGKNVKDMASYKFWSTQPVMKLDEAADKPFEEGPLKVMKVEDVPTSPAPLGIDKFEWVTMDLTQESQLKEVYDLLNLHYVEDEEAMFRFKYGTDILRWALLSPGWKKEWHVGIRGNGKLCAFISAIPVQIRIRDKVVKGSEVNFMVVHKKLRNKRLAPVLIKEITRLCNLDGVWQAIYTAGVVLPKPVSTCRYYHRAINWQKLYEIGFSPCPPNSKPAFQVRKYALPDQTTTKGLREMEAKDIDAVHQLLKRYLDKFDLAPDFTREEIEHWLLHKKESTGERVIYTYVVEDDKKEITDFFSFYALDSSVIKHQKHSVIHAAYGFYYATESGLTTPYDKSAEKARLNALMHDALILAKRYKFDVFNALSLLHNGLFLEDQKFGPGDGQLHFYIFNYRANPIAGGVNKKNQLDEDHLSKVGFVML
ncbi:Glycylpeptide N-tetradecanoyltransferase [Coniochaeta hoffmannii]|uniref:Glycylpeptide N-tetradecanoyltransferase n=1 Tax=Coniochaeta hoffmannii TaxID=91930 RepID=A0AA38R590_9PEZI|nr:Glycylpeptide N-tetradecanoyltransferase [Coniochaeta hoffmannii]